MPLVQTRGAASAQGFGEFAQATAVTYIEDVFSTWLIKTPGSAIAVGAVNNSIDLSTKGGMVWLKDRNFTYSHTLVDTARGATQRLISNTTAAQASTSTYGFTSFNTNGFTLGDGGGVLFDNGGSGTNVASWSFRKQAKFFDVVTWTGNATNRTIAHSLGSVPGSIIVKRTDTTAAWAVYHRSLANTQYLVLNTTAAAATGATWWNSTTPTSSVFSVGTDASVNASGGTYVAYLFAHNAGGFGLTGTDNVISCGLTALDVSGFATVSLGYEPQFVMIKSTQYAGDWAIYDTMRGAVALKDSSLYSAFSAQKLLANSSAAESTVTDYTIAPSSTGFTLSATGYAGAAYDDFIYIAIRKGPMKVPTVGTTVFSPITYVGANGAAQNISAGFPVDMDIIKIRNDATRDPLNHARLMGGVFLATDTTGAQQSYSDNIVSFNNAQNVIGLPVTGGGTNEINGASTSTYVAWSFRRAPSFMDAVCYTGTGASSQVLTHNLQAIPTLTIFKKRSATNPWDVVSGNTSYLQLNETLQAFPDTSIAATTTTITAALGAGNGLNASGATYVAYLFATCAGVSKVFSYTGNGSSQTINCGFTAGSRWVMIKRTDSTGDWYVWDSARGIIAGNDPHLSLNTTAAEVTTDDSVDTDNTGFIVNQLSATNINVTSATYIGFAIA